MAHALDIATVLKHRTRRNFFCIRVCQITSSIYTSLALGLFFSYYSTHEISATNILHSVISTGFKDSPWLDFLSLTPPLEPHRSPQILQMALRKEISTC